MRQPIPTNIQNLWQVFPITSAGSLPNCLPLMMQCA